MTGIIVKILNANVIHSVLEYEDVKKALTRLERLVNVFGSYDGVLNNFDH